jgi:hypothetical protein
MEFKLWMLGIIAVMCVYGIFAVYFSKSSESKSN